MSTQELIIWHCEVCLLDGSQNKVETYVTAVPELRSPARRSPTKGVGLKALNLQIDTNRIDWIQAEDLDDDQFASERPLSPFALKCSINTENRAPSVGKK
jgi:hypothetical protein